MRTRRSVRWCSLCCGLLGDWAVDADLSATEVMGYDPVLGMDLHAEPKGSMPAWRRLRPELDRHGQLAGGR